MNYQNGKIYKITADIDEEDGNIYIGSTTQTLCKRMAKHRGDFKLYEKGREKKCYSFDLIKKYGLDRVRIILIENFPCNSREELVKREAYYIRSLPCCNKIIPDRTQEEWRNENREKLLEYKKEYNKHYVVENKEILAEYKKQYYENNRELIVEKAREYRENNSEKLLAITKNTVKKIENY